MPEEARGGLAVVENVLWASVPKFLRKLNDVVKSECGEALPLEIAPIKMASWMGGDRDGEWRRHLISSFLPRHKLNIFL